MEREVPGAGVYAAALVLTIVALALGNLIVGYLGGAAGIGAGTPAAAALGFVQGLAGALLAGFASRQLLKSAGPADFWLKWIVILAAALFALAIVWLLATGKSASALNWTTYTGLAALLGTEVGRRIAGGLFRVSGAEDVAASRS
jgi:preprotein translocase subunit SecG